MQVLGAVLEPGERASGSLKVGQRASGSAIGIPWFAIRGLDDGPLLWLTGVVHGDELAAPFVMERVYRGLDVQRLRGTVFMTPVGNPAALDGRSKLSPYDFLDMDQQFPGDATGQLSQRTAHAIMKVFELQPDYVLSFHTLATPYDAIVYTNFRSMPGVAPDVEGRARSLALAFGADLTCRIDVTQTRREIPGNITGSIDSVALQSGIPAIMVELGGGGRLDLDAVDRGVTGVRNVLNFANMLEGHAQLPPRQTVVTKRAFIYSNDAGLFAANVTVGELLRRGDSLGTILNLGTLEAEDVEPFNEDSIVIAVRRDPLAHSGDRLALLATGWDTVENVPVQSE